MDSYAAEVEEKLVPCPNDKSHMILASRLTRHLVKCNRNHQTGNKTTCTFNANHRIDEPEVRYHEKNCEHRINLDKYIYKEKNDDSHVPKIEKLDVAVTEEWDVETPHPTYNPEEHINTYGIIRKTYKDTLSSSIKKKLSLQEKERLQKFNTKKEEEVIIESNNEHEDYLKEKKLRRPLNQSIASQSESINESVILNKIKTDSKIVTTPRIGVTLINSATINKENIDRTTQSLSTHFNEVCSVSTKPSENKSKLTSEPKKFVWGSQRQVNPTIQDMTKNEYVKDVNFPKLNEKY